jgi:hypothetical protein
VLLLLTLRWKEPLLCEDENERVGDPAASFQAPHALGQLDALFINPASCIGFLRMELTDSGVRRLSCHDLGDEPGVLLPKSSASSFRKSAAGRLYSADNLLRLLGVSEAIPFFRGELELESLVLLNSLLSMALLFALLRCLTVAS